MKKILIFLLFIMILCTNVSLAADDKKDPMLFLYSIVGTTETYVDLDVVPGEEATFSIKLYNSGTTTKTNSMFISDGITANNGGTMVLTPEEAQREKAGSWLNIVEEEVTLKPGQKKVFDFIVDVPKNARPGTHVAVLYLRSAVNSGVESEKSSNGASFVINEAYSLSSAVILRTGGIIKYDFLIEDMMEKKWIRDKDLTLFFDIANTGNTYDYPKANILMVDNNDEVVYNTEREMGVVYPDNHCIVNFSIPAEVYHSDIYKIVFSLDYGKNPLKNVQREFILDLSSKEVVDAKTKIESAQSGTETALGSDTSNVALLSQPNNNEHMLMDNVILIAPMIFIIAVLTVIIRLILCLRRKSKKTGICNFN